MKKIGDLIGHVPIPSIFKVRSDLQGKIEPLQPFWESCPQCQRERLIPVWPYIQQGETQEYRFATICTACQNNIKRYNGKEDVKAAKASKWYHIDKNDSCGFKNYEVVGKATEKAVKIAKDYAREIMKNNLTLNLLIMGSTGTGKSHLAKTVAKTAKEKGLDVAYIEAVQLFELIKGTFGHERHNEMLFKEFKDFDLVVIDDVGLETKKQGEVSWSVSEWTKLINAREGKATVWTTNFDDNALGEVVGKRAFSRMYMDTKFIDLFTDDYRKKLRG